ncbi:MAG: hypothetical protein Q8P61_01825 [Candidatus Nanopelagicales bacterium]|nr:hypothetical protein [Candidatus Nanopelagicales bacterium]
MTRTGVRAAVLVAAVCLPLGVGSGWLWVRLVDGAEPVVADLTLGLIGFIVGVIWSFVALWFVGRRFPDGVFVGLVVGGVVGSMVAYRFGQVIGVDATGDLALKAPGVLLMWPLGSCLVGFGVGVTRRVHGRLGEPSAAEK